MKARIWYYLLEGRNYGPIPGTELALHIRTGTIQPETKIWYDGMDAWQEAKAVPEFENVRPRPVVVRRTRPPHIANKIERETRKRKALGITLPALPFEMYILAGLAAITGLMWFMQMADRFFFTAIILFFGCGITAGVGTLVRSFQKHWAWCLVTLLGGPIGSFIYYAVDFRKAWGIVVMVALMYFGTYFYLTGLDFSGVQHEETLRQFQDMVRLKYGG
ncbi:MAG: DUF4339 domain-containing protein [Verrucomicrobiota bacterium]